MSRLTESAIEEFAIKLLERLGYDYTYGPDIAPDSDHPERSRFDGVLLSKRLSAAVQRINPLIPFIAQQQAIKEILISKMLQPTPKTSSFRQGCRDRAPIRATYQQGESPCRRMP